MSCHALETLSSMRHISSFPLKLCKAVQVYKSESILQECLKPIEIIKIFFIFFFVSNEKEFLSFYIEAGEPEAFNFKILKTHWSHGSFSLPFSVSTETRHYVLKTLLHWSCFLGWSGAPGFGWGNCLFSMRDFQLLKFSWLF